MEFSEGGAVLDIKFAVVKDAASYKCTATNRGGRQTAELKVMRGQKYCEILILDRRYQVRSSGKDFKGFFKKRFGLILGQQSH